MFDKSEVGFWRELKVSDILTLSDEATLKLAMEEGLGPNPVDYTVKSVRKLSHEKGTIDWYLFELTNDSFSQPLWLMVKIVENDFDLRVYHQVDEFVPRSRAQLVDDGDFWIFHEPDDPDNFEFGDLNFTELITDDNEEGADEEWHYEYGQKPQGELMAAVTDIPQQSGSEVKLLALVVEYSAGEEDCPEPEMLILEVFPEPDCSPSDPDDEDEEEDQDADDSGEVDEGLVTLYKGAALGLNDLDTLKH
jgi:hypothetical protein